MKSTVKVGTRKSDLALQQTIWVVKNLKRFHPGYTFEIVGIKTKGDKIKDTALSKIGGKGLFTKELEIAMMEGKIDLAVHSMKDLPTELPEGLTIGAVCRRENPADALVSRKDLKFDELPAGARIGTCSLRRAAQLLYYRPDLQIFPLRGNVDTRLKKIANNNLDAAVLAAAGLYRMGLKNRITEYLNFEICLPAVGQGSIGIEIRANDELVQEIVRKLDDFNARAAITAERAFLNRLSDDENNVHGERQEGGCQVPIGAYGRIKCNSLILDGMVANPDGSYLVRSKVSGALDEPEKLGVKLAEKLIDMGAGSILEKVRRAARKNNDLC